MLPNIGKYMIIAMLLIGVMFQGAVLKCRCHVFVSDLSKNKYAMYVVRAAP